MKIVKKLGFYTVFEASEGANRVMKKPISVASKYFILPLYGEKSKLYTSASKRAKNTWYFLENQDCPRIVLENLFERLV